MKSYRQLDIYNDSKKFAVEVHKMSLALPKFELYEEGSQISKRINKFIQWVEERWNEFPPPETGNL